MRVRVGYSVMRARLLVDDRTAAFVDMQWQDDVILLRLGDPAKSGEGELIGVAFTRSSAITFATSYLERLGEIHKAEAARCVRVGRHVVRAA